MRLNILDLCYENKRKTECRKHADRTFLHFFFKSFPNGSFASNVSGNSELSVNSGDHMVEFESKDNRNRVVLLSSIATSVVLMNIFLLGALLVNMYAVEAAYTLVDIIAGCIFVFFITMIISLSLWPKIMDWLDSREKVTKSVK